MIAGPPERDNSNAGILGFYDLIELIDDVKARLEELERHLRELPMAERRRRGGPSPCPLP
jgi:hypothetical protein